MGGGFWKNKLLSFIKRHRLDFPRMKITAMVECEIVVNGEALHFTMPIVLGKETKNEARELMYGEVYDGLLEHFDEKTKEHKKDRKEADKRRKKIEMEDKIVDKAEIDNKRLVKSTKGSNRKSKRDHDSNTQNTQNTPNTPKVIKFQEIEESNIGFKLLEKMGWVKGEGINGGMKEPISVVVRKKNSGLGS